MRRTSTAATSLILRIPILLDGAQQVQFVNPYAKLTGAKSEGSKKLRLGCSLWRGGFLGGLRLDSSASGRGGDSDGENQKDENGELLFTPLVLPVDREGHEVNVPSVCARVLREHQREGVAFVFKCLMGLADYPEDFAKQVEDISQAKGCILADDMGLGKTLQSISVLWTLLKRTDKSGKICNHHAL